MIKNLKTNTELESKILEILKNNLDTNKNNLETNQDNLNKNQDNLNKNQDNLYANQNNLDKNQDNLNANEDNLDKNQDNLNENQDNLDENQENKNNSDEKKEKKKEKKKKKKKKTYDDDTGIYYHVPKLSDIMKEEWRHGDFVSFLLLLAYCRELIEKHFTSKIKNFYREQRWYLKLIFYIVSISLILGLLSYGYILHHFRIDEAALFIYKNNWNADESNRVVYIKTFYNELHKGKYEDYFQKVESILSKVFPSTFTDTPKLRGHHFVFTEISESEWIAFSGADFRNYNKGLAELKSQLESPSFLDYGKTILNIVVRDEGYAGFDFDTAQIRNKARWDRFLIDYTLTTRDEVNDIRFDLAMDDLYNKRKEFKMKFKEKTGYKFPNFLKIIPPYYRYIDIWNRILM